MHINKLLIVIIGVLCVTLIFLGYVAQAVSHLKLSYRINSYSKELSACYEEHRKLKYKLAALTSPAQLEKQCELHGLELVAPRAVRLIELPCLERLPVDTHEAIQTKGLFSSLQFGSVAQAETSDS